MTTWKIVRFRMVVLLVVSLSCGGFADSQGAKLGLLDDGLSRGAYSFAQASGLVTSILPRNRPVALPEREDPEPR